MTGGGDGGEEAWQQRQRDTWSFKKFGHCFDLFGLDVMFSKEGDGRLRPQLMEVNLGPDLTSHHGWDVELAIYNTCMHACLTACMADQGVGL